MQEVGCFQPHYSIQQRLDDTVNTLVLLPMNTKKDHVYEYVNSNIQRICNRGGASKTRFGKLWREECPHVQIPLYSQFSKCFHCWKYKCSMDTTTNTTIHTAHQMKERRDY
jgi:hypothetical protein